MELIKEFFEKDIGLSNGCNNQTQYTVRKAARIVLFNSDNKIAILSVKNGNYHKLPGGGIEFGENVREALEREAQEEAGADISIEGELGMTIEYKEQHQQLQFSYCYYGHVRGEILAPSFTEQEKQDGFGLSWMDLKSAIKCIRNDTPDSYIGKFIKNRDLSILCKAEEILNKSGLYADEQAVENTSIEDLDLLMVNEFIEKRLEEKVEDGPLPLERILSSMKILTGKKCTLAGLLLFAKKKHLALSHYGIGAVSWYGNDLSGTEYRDSEDIKGNVAKLFADGMGFLKRQLRKLQNGQGFNTLGILEIPEIALEEALVNAIVHRNYFINSNIRLLVFDGRVEIISPGLLPNTLSVESIKTGVHVVRNPILLSHIKDIPGIPYRGMGTGVSRIVKSCKEAGINVEFVNEVEAEQFKVIFWRKS